MIQNNFVSHLFDSPNHTAVVNFSNIPKSVQQLVIIHGLISSQGLGFQIRQKYRNSTTYQIFNTHKITNIRGIVLFLAQQCYDNVQSCDFYSSYITSCSKDYSFCNCLEDGYYLNSTNECDQCSLNCGNCFKIKTNCTSCNPIQFKTLVNNDCICTGNRFLDTSSNIDQNQNNILCSPSCDTCYGPNTNQCKSCGLNSYLSQNNECFCISGYFNNNNLCTKCDSSCAECADGIQCLSCAFNRYFDDIQNQCICLQGYYESEDDYCKSCDSRCKACDGSENCLECWPNQILIEGKCVCVQGFYLERNTCLSCQSESGKFNNLCKVLDCSDGLWSPYEECDDGNKIQRDGCSQCLIDPKYQCINVVRQKSICFQCQLNCLQCDQLNCYKCHDGYFLNNNNCIRCSQQCQTCINTSNQCLTCAIDSQIPDQNWHCQECSIGTYLENNQCIPQCGDGIKTLLEECDDGNLLEGDGCNQSCQIEPKHYCFEIEQQSICLSNRLKVFFKQIHPLSSDSYFIQIQSSEMIHFTNLEFYIESDYINQDIFIYNSTYLKSSQQLQILQINCTINFNQSVDLIVLRFIINGSIQNGMKQPLNVNTINYSFQNIIRMTSQQKETTQSVNKQASYQIQVTLVLLILSIIIFGIGQSSKMVRVNNIVSFIKYIDVQFPPNYMEFLIQLEDLNLINNIDFTKLIEISNLLPQAVIQYIEPVKELNQFKKKESFIINILPFLINLIACYVLMKYFQFQASVIKKLIYKRYYKNIHSINSTSHKILVWLELYSRKLFVETNSKGYQELYLAFEYNIFFFISLQLISLNFTTKYGLVNLTLAIGFFMHYIRQLYLKLKNKKIQLGNRVFNLLRLLDPCLYIFCIVFLKNLPLCQLLIIQIPHTLMILSLIRQPFQQSLYYYQMIVEEIFLVLTFMSFLIYIYFPIELDYVLMGFLQMGFLSSIFTANFIIQIYELIQKLKQLYSKHQRKLQKQKENSKSNPHQLIQLAK